MKITEISREVTQEELDEAFFRPLGSAVKGLVQGGVSGAAAGWRAKQSAIQQQKMIRYLAQQATGAWGQQVQNLTTAGRPPKPIDAQQFLGQWIGGNAVSRPASVSPANFKTWAEKEIANRLAGGEAVPGITSGEDGAPGEAPAPKPGETPKPGEAPAPKPGETPKPGEAPAPKPGEGSPGGAGGPGAGGSASTAVYSDYRALRANWIAWNRHPEFKPLVDDPDLLNALKRVQSRSSTIREHFTRKRQAILEAKQVQLLESFAIYRGFRDLRQNLTEAELSQEQIRQIFQAVGQGAAAGGNVDMEGDAPVSNKTLIGKAAGLADKWEEAKGKIQRLGGIAAMDSFMDKIQGGIIRKFGGDRGQAARMVQWYREVSKSSPVLKTAVYAGLIALAGFSGGGAAIGLAAGARMLDSLLMGDKLSSSLYKAAKTAAIAAGLGALKDYMAKGPDPLEPVGGDEFIPTRGMEPVGGDEFIPTRGMEPVGGDEFIPTSDSGPVGADEFIPTREPSVVQYTAKAGDNLSTIAQKNNVSTDELLKLNPKITNPDVLQAGQTVNIPQPTGSNVYAGGVGTAADTQAKIASGTYTPSEISARAAERAGLRESRVSETVLDYAKIHATFMIQESLRLPQRSAAYITPNGVRRVFESVEQLSEAPWDNPVRGEVANVSGLPSDAQVNDRYRVGDEIYKFDGANWAAEPKSTWQKIKTGVANAASTAWDDAKNKITANRLDVSWRRGGNITTGPVDSVKVAEFLRSQGVKDGLIKKVFTDLSIPLDGVMTPETTPPAPGPGETPPAPGPGETPPAPGPGETPPAPGPGETPPAPKPGEGGGSGGTEPIFGNPYEFEEGFYDYLKAGGKITQPWLNVLNDIISKGLRVPSEKKPGEDGDAAGGRGGVTVNVNAAGGAGGSATGGTSTATGGTATADARAAAAAATGGGATTSRSASGSNPAAPKRPHTGGKKKGEYSMTSNAIRKREARRRPAGTTAATATAESFDFNGSALYERLMSMDLEEQTPMATAQDAYNNRTTLGQKVWGAARRFGDASGTKSTYVDYNKGGTAQQMGTSLGGKMSTAADIISRSSGAPSMKSFADATNISSEVSRRIAQDKAREQEQGDAQAAAQPAAQTATMGRGQALNVPAIGNAPAKTYTLRGNTYVTADGKPVAADINQLLHSINYGKVKRS